MPKHDLSETGGAIAYATDAVVAALAARLDALVASWQLAIDARRRAPLADEGMTIRPAADVLAELERQLDDLDRRCGKQREAADSQSREAEDWERRAMTAVREGRDDLATQALNNVGNHRDAATQLTAEAAELEALRESYRNAIAAIRSTTSATPTT